MCLNLGWLRILQYGKPFGEDLPNELVVKMHEFYNEFVIPRDYESWISVDQGKVNQVEILICKTQYII